MHIHNRCPTMEVENKNPEEAWSGEKPMVKYFRMDMLHMFMYQIKEGASWMIRAENVSS